MHATEDRLLRLASRQAGCFSLAQARAAGLSDVVLCRRVRNGSLSRVQPATYRFTALPPSAGTRVWGAVLAVGGSAAGAGSALWRLGLLDPPPERPTLVVPGAVRPRGLVGVRVLRSDAGLGALRTVGGMRVQRCAPALAALLCERGPGASHTLDRALQLRAVDLAEVVAALDRCPRARGVVAARRVVAAAADGTASEAERLAVRTLRGAGLTGFACNVRVGRYLGDIVYRAERVLVEIDGFAAHGGATAFQADRVRQNAIALCGWTVLRFTWRDLVGSPDRVADTVARALGRTGDRVDTDLP